MRSALICVIVTLVAQRGSSEDNDFRPTPIPLNEWHYEEREHRAGTYFEPVKPEDLPSAAVPAHYWEDALRHSVYLTLVRDKIDQLIAKGDIISPDAKPEHYVPKEVDDHDLWEKIKSAPFDRVAEEEPDSPEDVTIMAKGRLTKEKNGYRFSEDKPSKEMCLDGKCMEGVKALWSVKRVRQRESETSSGRYHYELTFSVISQTPKIERKPYENPIRTFTVRESVPERVVEMPQEHRSIERPQPTERPGRAIWFHKNIAPTQRYQGRQYQHGLDRLFSSLFSDEEEDYEPPRYRPSPHAQPAYLQYSKAGYVGSPSDQQKRLTPYPYKPHSYKYSRPLPPIHPPYLQHHFLEMDNVGVVNSPHPDHRYVTPNKPNKNTRPAVLPTAPSFQQPSKNWTTEGDKKKPNNTDNSTRAPESYSAHRNHNKPRPGPMKINYLSDHVRPPIYNAPPGVFVTMDKKPFKPMPPMKLLSKPHKQKPLDFRPSPQVLDMQQFSEPNSSFDAAFRPITWNYSDSNATELITEKIETAESSTEVNNTRKSNTKGKKPPKKHENIKSQRIPTSTPEIITASSDSEEESDVLQWANIVGAFAKTTPMEPQTEKAEIPETTTPLPTTTTVPISTVKRRTTTTTEAVKETTTTTPKPIKRTRPPPKFTKPEKVKKHKRITTTTTKSPEKKTTLDLTPQASSAAATKPSWSPANKTQTTTPLSTTSSTTTAKPTTTTTRATTTSHAPSSTTTTSTTTEEKTTSVNTQPKPKNRFRQSTLMQKGTSVNHDKWTAPTLDKTPRPLTGKPGRRKGSNFQGYLSTTPLNSDKGDQEINMSVAPISTTTIATTQKTTKATSPIYEDTADQYETNSELSDYSYNQEDAEMETLQEEMERLAENENHDSRDENEFIFPASSTTLSEKTNEIVEQEPITEQIITSVHSVPKNKTKCKKKKHQNTTNTEVLLNETNFEQEPSTSTTTVASPTPSILEELFGGFTVDESMQKDSQSTPKPELQEQESENHQQFVKLDDDLQDFLDSLNDGGKTSEVDEQYEDDDDDEDYDKEPAIDDEDSFESDYDSSPRASEVSESVQDRPYSLLELMAME